MKHIDPTSSRDTRSIPNSSSLVSCSRATGALTQGTCAMRRTQCVSVLVALVLLTCAACSSPSTDPSNGPSPSSSPSASTGSTPRPRSPTVPAYLRAYTANQRTAFAAAVSAYHRFLRQNDRFLAAGRVPRQAGSYYYKYAIRGSASWTALARLVDSGVTVRGHAEERWVRPVHVAVQRQQRSMVILRRCLDEQGIRVFQHGKSIAQPQLARPHIYRVTMIKRSNETWWRAGTPKRSATC